MNKYLIYRIAFVMMLLQTVHSQTKTGTTVGQFLLIEPSAKISAMGNAGVAQYDEVMASYFNPAALGHMSTSGRNSLIRLGSQASRSIISRLRCV